MALQKVEYKNNQTVITAENMNAIQDEVIAHEGILLGIVRILGDLSNWISTFDPGNVNTLTIEDGVLTLSFGTFNNSGVRSKDVATAFVQGYPLSVEVDVNYTGDGTITMYAVADGSLSISRWLTNGHNSFSFSAEKFAGKEMNTLYFVIAVAGASTLGTLTLSNFLVSQSVGNLTSKVEANAQAIKQLREEKAEEATKIVEEVHVDNTIALEAWNNAQILSSIDDCVRFTSQAIGEHGLQVQLIDTVDASRPLYIKYNADYDKSVLTVNVNIYNGAGLVRTVLNTVTGSEVEHSFDLSAVDCSTVNIIISANFENAASVGKELSISAFRVYQEQEVPISVTDEHELRISELETSKNFLVAPNGENYLLQVGADGSFVMTPAIPAKALFIGNSLLIGFGTFGMAASDNEHDYYYLINQAITAKKSAYTVSKMSGTSWEAATSAETQNTFLNDTLLPRLSEDLDLVIVQLGDNVNTDAKKAVFAQGCRSMLEFIRTHAPKARVVWVGAWYQTAQKQEQMIAACEKTGSTFINIWDLATTENKSAVGNTYIDSNGAEQTITSAGVASHPGDAGFKAIANRVLYKLGIVDTEEYYS